MKHGGKESKGEGTTEVRKQASKQAKKQASKYIIIGYK